MSDDDTNHARDAQPGPPAGGDSPPGDDLDDGLLDPDLPDPTTDLTTTQAPGSVFADVHAFVTDYLAEVWARSVRETDTGFRWCPRWHDHRVALDRLTALWEAYEVLHAEGGTGPARWWREHADPTLAALTAPKGPFARCGPGRHETPPKLALDDPATTEPAKA